MNFKINDTVFNPILGTFKVKAVLEQFNDLVDINVPLLLVYDINIGKEVYIPYENFKELKYDYVKMSILSNVDSLKGKQI